MRSYKVVIAEDEALILKNLTVMLEKEHPRFQVVGVASNGQEGISLVEKLRPDLLMTDIRMPIADGLSILRYIHEHKLPTASVIISGFDQFQYAQQALRYGACEYLLKPITSAQLSHTLKEVEAGVLVRERKEESFDLDLALSGHIATFPVSHSCYHLILAYRGNFCFGTEPPSSQTPCFLSLEQDELELLLDNEELWLSKSNTGSYQFLLLGCDSSGCAWAFARALFTSLQTNCADDIVSILTCPVSVASQLAKSAETLYRQLQRKAVLGKPLYWESGRLASGSSMQELFGECSAHGEHLIQSLYQKDNTKLKIILHDLVSCWRKKACPTSTILNLVKFQYMQANKELSIPLSVDWEDRISRVFSTASNWEQLEKSLYYLFLDLQPDSSDTLSSNDIMQMIDQYIRTHYTERITNQTLSKQYGFVPSYISRLFKEYKGISPCEYVTQIRISKAKQMITDSFDINVSDVATAVGFSDPSYFSRLFKQQIGMLPTEYREAVKQQVCTLLP